MNVKKGLNTHLKIKIKLLIKLLISHSLISNDHPIHHFSFCLCVIIKFLIELHR